MITEAGQGSPLPLYDRLVTSARGRMGGISAESVEQRSLDLTEGYSSPSSEARIGHESVSKLAHLVLLTVASVERTHYVGAAFDCTTESSLYCSDGFVVSNCGRSASAISTDEARERGVDQGEDVPDDTEPEVSGDE